MTVLSLCIIIFITQVIFLFSRTMNVKAIAEGRVFRSIWTGWIIHVSWLVSVGIGAESMIDVMINFQWESIPIVLCSLAGGTIGTYYPMKMNQKSK